MQAVDSTDQSIIRDAQIHLSSFLPLRTILAYLVIAFFIYSFFSGLTYKFYASFLFLFYSLIGRMWIAVVCLGIFQVLLMIPFRVINLKISNHINEFKEKTQELTSEQEQSFLVRRTIRKGKRSLLFYTIDFVVQLTLYVSIGRLFLTDFYRRPLDPELLFSFVPYPNYPIQSTIFKIPYPAVTDTKDLGLLAVLVVWALILLLGIGVYFMRQLNRRVKGEAYRIDVPRKFKQYAKLVSGNSIILLVITWIILRHFPVGIRLGIFSGDISVPNRTFNTVTATVTFATILWFGSNKIVRKVKLAVAQHVDREIVFETQKNVQANFKKRNAGWIGGLFYNQTNPECV